LKISSLPRASLQEQKNIASQCTFVPIPLYVRKRPTKVYLRARLKISSLPRASLQKRTSSSQMLAVVFFFRPFLRQ
jgi:hypothetical protein